MLEAIMSALGEMFQVQNVIFIIAGVALGLIFGAVPGLGGDSALALLIPVTFGMEPGSAILLLISTQGAAAFGGSIPAILINTPGTSQNVATCFDGYPMTQQGKAGLALAASATSSALGAIVSIFILIALLPFARQAILIFSFPEMFMIAVVGLSVISAICKGNIMRGLISTGFGIALSFIGWEQVNAGLRYTFGVGYLYDGIDFVPVIIGLFAITEAINLLIKGGSIASKETPKVTFWGADGLWAGIKSVFNNFGVFARSVAVGTIVGIIPGVGGSVANVMAYMQAVQTCPNAENFGKGDVRGVIAPETANNAKDGGALLPTLAFGIPGSSGMAILMGGFLIHGITPGRDLMTNHLDLVWIVILSLAISNVLAAGIGLLLSPYSSSIAKIPGKILAPIIFIISIVGAYALSFQIGDVIIAIIFGIVGYYIQKYRFSSVAIILGIILGPIMEQNYHLTIQTMGIKGFFNRPISLGLLVVTILTLLYPVFKNRRDNKKTRAENPTL